MRGEIIRQITGSGQITNGISVAPASVYTDDRSNLSPSTYLTISHSALRGAALQGAPSKRNFCNCSIDSPAFPLLFSLTIIVSTWKRPAGWNWRKYVVNVYNNKFLHIFQTFFEQRDEVYSNLVKRFSENFLVFQVFLFKVPGKEKIS